MSNLTSLTQVRGIAADLGFHPSRSLGQNFLIDRNILDIFMNAANLRPEDVVLEIGPGLGVVTERLASACRHVVAVEKDKTLAAFLKKRFEGERGLELIHADMLDPAGEKIMSGKFDKVVSNLPYAVGTRILMNLATRETPAEQITVTVQEEVAERLAAAPGTRDYGLASVWLQLVYDVEIVKTVSATCFWPKPDVQSCIVNMRRKAGALTLRMDLRQSLYELTRRAFEHRRKQLASILARLGLSGMEMSAAEFQGLLDDLGIAVKARPENLGAEDWYRLTRRVRLL